MKKSKFEKFIKFLFPVPFILGVIGYTQAGYPIGDALYGSFCFYFVSVYSKAYNMYMEIARWTAPIMTVSWVLLSFRTAFEIFKMYLTSRRKDAIVIYCDDNREAARELSYKIPNSYVVECSNDSDVAFNPSIKEQILYFSQDRNNLEFYNEHSYALTDKKVHIILKDIDPYHLKESNVHYFSIPNQTAIELWTKNPIARGMTDDHNYKVAIIGGGSLAETILKQGLTLNIFFKDQCVEYHTFGNWRLFKKAFGSLDLMNNDRIIFHENNWCENIDVLKDMDRIIIVEKDNIRIIEFLMSYCPGAEIMYFSESNENPARFYSSDRVQDFGTIESLVNMENVLGGLSEYKSKELYYLSLSDDIDTSIDSDKVDAEWNKLNGAIRKEHTDRAYYYELYTNLLNEGVKLSKSPFAIAPLEHIRWCRTRLLTFWKYGEPEDGSFGDAELKIHRSLVPYNELPDDVQDVELQQIIFMMHHLK